jgi:hypothetical protein
VAKACGQGRADAWFSSHGSLGGIRPDLPRSGAAPHRAEHDRAERERWNASGWTKCPSSAILRTTYYVVLR